MDSLLSALGVFLGREFVTFKNNKGLFKKIYKGKGMISEKNERHPR